MDNFLDPAYLALRAIMQIVETVRLPQFGLSDIAVDAHVLYTDRPARFVYIVRRQGTHLCTSQKSLDELLSSGILDGGALYYTWATPDTTMCQVSSRLAREFLKVGE